MPESQTLTNANPSEGETRRGLNVTDLLTLAQLIQLSAQRGTWRAEELSTVGTAYDNLLAFLQASGAIQRAPAADAQPTPDAEAGTQGEETTNA